MLKGIKKLFAFCIIFAIILCISSCRSTKYNENLSPDEVLDAYADTKYSVFFKTVAESDFSEIAYRYSIKVYNPENESRDYIFIYFFDDENEAIDFENTGKSKSGIIRFVSMIFGESVTADYKRYGNIVVESNKASASRKEMIRIFENTIFQ